MRDARLGFQYCIQNKGCHCSPQEGVEGGAPLLGDFRLIVCLTPPQMNDFGDLLGTPYAPVSKIAPVKQKMGFLRNTQNLLYCKKSKSISSPEPKYFLHFALRYRVSNVKKRVEDVPNFCGLPRISELYLHTAYNSALLMPQHYKKKLSYVLHTYTASAYC